MKKIVNSPLTETLNPSAINFSINNLNSTCMRNFTFSEKNGSYATSVTSRAKKSKQKAPKQGWLNSLYWMVNAWLYHNQGLEGDWRFSGRTWWLKYQRYLRDVKQLRRIRLSGKNIKDIEPWCEVILSDGTSVFVNGCCSYESFDRNFIQDTPTGYMDTYMDPSIVRVGRKNAKAKRA